MAQIKAKIISNSRLIGNYWYLEFESRQIAQQSSPGQFVNIKVSDSMAPLLRRPLSIHAVCASQVKVIYELRGEGTQILSSRKPGEILDIIGPLGNGFSYRRILKSRGINNILIAGGIGVAPLVFLAKELKSTKPLVLIGARTKKDILCAREFKALGCAVKFATDDGSVGFKGRVTDLLKIILAEHKISGIFSCGPHLMLKTVTQIAKENKIDAQLSLEEHMACGVGACLGCVVETKDGYKTVCKDGPVFSSEELAW